MSPTPTFLSPAWEPRGPAGPGWGEASSSVGGGPRVSHMPPSELKTPW